MAALLLTVWDTGERIGAVWQVTWDDVDLSGGWVRVPAETRKGRRTDRLYRLSADAVAALAPLRANGRGPVFSTHFRLQALWIRLRRLLVRAGLPADRKSKFHRIRKSVASYVAAAGGDAQAVLGHSSPRADNGPKILPDFLRKCRKSLCVRALRRQKIRPDFPFSYCP